MFKTLAQSWPWQAHEKFVSRQILRPAPLLPDRFARKRHPAVMLFLKNVKKSFADPDGNACCRFSTFPSFMWRPASRWPDGRSGCGKTTLLHVIAGISRPDSGLVQVGGLRPGLLSEHGRDRFRADNDRLRLSDVQLACLAFRPWKTCCWA